MSTTAYVIHWKNRKTGVEGCDDTELTQAEAEISVRMLNSEQPAFEHWYAEKCKKIEWTIEQMLEREG